MERLTEFLVYSETEAFDSILEQGYIEVDEQARFVITKFHVGQCLSNMYIRDLVYRF